MTLAISYLKSYWYWTDGLLDWTCLLSEVGGVKGIGRNLRKVVCLFIPKWFSWQSETRACANHIHALELKVQGATLFGSITTASNIIQEAVSIHQDQESHHINGSLFSFKILYWKVIELFFAINIKYYL